jgi:tetratricopeptide (TPR) repeat protein
MAVNNAPVFHERYGLPLSTRSAVAARWYSEGVDRHLSRSAGARVCFEAAIAADPDFVLAQAVLTGRDALKTAGSAAAERLRALADGASPWERRHVELIVAHGSGQILRAALLARQQLAEFPRDVLALQRAIALVESGGRRDWPRQRLALLDELASAYGDDWYFLGAYSRAHCEVGRLEEARRLAERALAGNPRSANAAHALAHVCYDTGEHASGLTFLGEWLADYDDDAPYHSHLTWHLALFELARGDRARALHRYERHLGRSGDGRGRGRLLDTASLLWRCQLAGARIDPLTWEPVRRLADHWTREAGPASATAHAALAYAACGDTAALDRLLSRLRGLDAGGDPLARPLMTPLVRGVAAFGAGRYEEAIAALEPIADEFVRLGGSRTQREMFEKTLVEAYRRAGRAPAMRERIADPLDRGETARELSSTT